VEANHLNGVILSNEPQPIPIDNEDRRFLVVGAKNKLEKSFYDQFKSMLTNGASAAFYDFLLNYPLSDFNEHTLPPRTDSKDSIIRFGLPGWHVFHEQWRNDELSVPYVSCISEDLYEYFLRWCERTRENKLTLTKFSALMGGREKKERKRVNASAAGKKQMRTVFVIEVTDGATIEKQCSQFSDAMAKL
jgi:putative DNA primase/helicase